MKLKHLLLACILIILIYFDIQWYLYCIKQQDDSWIACWWVIHTFIGIIILRIIIYYLVEETEFFDYMDRLLNKKIL